MSLRRKFLILLLALGAAVAINVGTVVWTMLFLERELALPLSSFQDVLTGLSRVKRSIGQIHGGIAGSENIGPVRAAPGPEPARDEAALAEFERLAADVLTGLSDLEANETYRLRAGVSTTQNLRGRVTQALDEARRWYGSGAGALDRAALLDLYFRLHELIERIEQWNLAELAKAGDYSAGLRQTVLLIVGASTLLVALVFWDAAIFVRRWAVKPVARLRLAAERLGAGDFAHRIEIEGRDEIAQLSGEVNHMAATIARMQTERIERERLAAVGEVVRRIVHNLRNPLAGIRGLAEYTRGEVAPNQDLREAQDRIMRTVDRFEQWLSGLLSATRPLDLSTGETPPASWLLGIVEMHRPAANAKGILLALDASNAPEVARFDARHLEQALVALLSNAIEASPRGGAVSVVAKRSLDSGDSWEIEVADQGPGVPGELRDQIFKPYFTTKPGGSGIGLAVAYQVITQHGGRITVGEPARNGQLAAEAAGAPPKHPGMGPGAVFRVVLPLAQMADIGQCGAQGGGSGKNSGH